MSHFTGLKMQNREVILPTGIKFQFDYRIDEWLIIEEWLIIRLQFPMRDNVIDNVYGINVVTGKSWRIESFSAPINNTYVAIVYDSNDSKLRAVDFSGVRVEINIADGTIRNVDFVK